MKAFLLSHAELNSMLEDLAAGHVPQILADALYGEASCSIHGCDCTPTPVERSVDLFNEAFVELQNATRDHGAFNSAHEGLAVIEEELDELRREVYKKRHERDPDKMHREAIQLAAMAIRFIRDVADRAPRGVPKLPAPPILLPDLRAPHSID